MCDCLKPIVSKLSQYNASQVVGGIVSQSVAKETSSLIGRVSLIGGLVGWLVG